MLRTLIIFLLSLVLALGSTVLLYRSEVDTMIAIGQEKLDEMINGEKPDTDKPSDDGDLKVESIALDTTGAKLVFNFGEKFTTEGLKVIATLKDGSTKEIPVDDCKINRPDTNNPGERQVVVVYEGHTARYNVTINLKAIPEISNTPLADITEKNDSVPYRVEAELIDMAISGVTKAEGVDSFVAAPPADADITSGDRYLTGYGVKWNYFGFTFTAAEKYEDVIIVLRVANATGSNLDAGALKMFLNYSQNDNGVESGLLPLDGYIIKADGAGKWTDIVIRNVTIPEGTNTLTFEAQGNKAFDLDYVDFYVGMRYINSVIEINDTTTIIKDLENFDTEKAFTRSDVANAHGLKDGQLFVETVSKESPGKSTNGGTSVGAIGKGSQMSTTIRLAQDATVLIKFKAASTGHGAYNVADHWNFYIDGVKLTTVETKNIEGGNQSESQWWDWMYTNVGAINLSAGDHFFLLEVHGTDCNVDTVEFEIVSLGSFDESGANLEDMKQPEQPPVEEDDKLVIDSKGEHKFEGEDFDQTNLTPTADWVNKGGIQIENVSQATPPTSGGKSLGACGGGYTTITFVLKEKATIQIYGRLAHAHGGAASKYMSVSLGDTELAPTGDLPAGDNATSMYWNWKNIPFGNAVELEAGEYTLTITFKSNPNVDCFIFDVISYGDVEEKEPFASIEAETFDDEGVVTRQDMIDAGRIPAGQYMSEVGNGATCICGFTSGTWFKFNFTVEEAMTLEMFLVGATDAGGYDVSTKLGLTINGKAVAIPSGLLTGSGDKPYWDWQTVSLGKVSLKAGDNEIVLTILNGHPNLDKVLFFEAEACAHANKNAAVQENVVNATCKDAGSYDEVVYCSDCGAEVSRVAKSIDKLAHTEETLTAVAPTCTESGLTEGKKCSVCGEIIVAQETVSAKGHSYSEEWTKDAIRHWHVCVNGCGINADEAVHTPNIAAPGENEAQVCTVCEYVIAAATGHINHTYTELKYDADSHWYKCTGCELTDGKIAHTFTNYISNNDATCTANGTETAKCEGCDQTHTQTDADSMLDHSFTTYTSNGDATCTADGTKTAKCDNCDATDVKADEGSKLAHTEQVLPAVAATSATTGLTEGKKCSVCGTVLVEQTVTPILKVTINAAGEYVFEGENLDMTNLTPSSGQTAVKVETPTSATPVTGNGQSLGCAGGGYTTLTFTLEQKATVQILGRLAHVNGGAASGYLTVLLDKGVLQLQGDLLKGDGAISQYWNWKDIPFGQALDLEAGTYTLTIRFKSNPNIDCIKFNVLTYGEFAPVTEGDLVIDGAGKYTYEAENVDQSSLVLRGDFIAINKYTFTEGWNNDFGSGSCLMGYTNGSIIRFYVDVKEATTLDIMMRMSYYSAATFDFSNTTITFAGQTLTPAPAGDFGHREATDYWKWVDVALGQVEVEAGIHLFEINFTKCDNHNLDYFRFTTVGEEPLPCDLICEHCGKCTNSECAQADHTAKCSGHDVVISGNNVYTLEAENWSQDNMTVRQDLVNANHAAINGNRLLENSGTTIGGMAAGSYISFNVYVKQDSTVAFVMKAAHSLECIINEAMSLTIDGVAVELSNNNILGSGSAPWFDWTTFTMGYANLSAGEHTIVLTFVENSPNMDYLTFDVMSYGSYSDTDVTLAASGTTKYELENIDCTQCLINTRSDFVPAVGAGNCGKGSGRIYGYADGSIFRVVVKVEQACTLEIKLAGFGGTALNAQQYYFGGNEIIPADGVKLGSGAVAEGLVGTVTVSEAGTYVFEFTSGGGTDLDYVSFTVVE